MTEWLKRWNVEIFTKGVLEASEKISEKENLNTSTKLKAKPSKKNNTLKKLHKKYPNTM